MSEVKKLRLCDWMLVFATAFILASGIQLEVTDSSSIAWVSIHIIIGSLFFANIVWHLYLHFGRKSWVQIHGKISFVFIALAIGHTVKRIKFFKFAKKS